MADTTHKTTNPWKIFAVLLIGGFMALLDVTIVNVALPSMQTGLQASSSALEWIVAGYALTLGLSLIPAGRIGDNIGHRQTFLAGMAVFTVASLLCSIAQTPTQIIIARLLQGVGAGIFQPAITSYIQLLFQGKDRSKAFGIFGAIIGLSSALGPLVGGLLVQSGGADLGWRLVFLVNVPIGIALLPLAYKMLPRNEHVGRRKHGLDPIGLTLLSAGLLLVLVPLIEGQQLDWPLWTFVCLITALPVFFALWQWERRLDDASQEPVLPIHLLRQRNFLAGCILALVYFASFTSIFFTLSILWQSGFAHNALATGLAIVPFALGSMVAAAQSHKLSERLGRRILAIGTGLVSLGLILTLVVLSEAQAPFSSWLLFGPLLIAGIGNGLFIAPNQDFILAGVERRDAGAAAGVLSTAQRIGSSLGIAAIGTLLFSHITVQGNGAQAVAEGFSHGAQAAFVLNIALILVSFMLVFALPKNLGNNAHAVEPAN